MTDPEFPFTEQDLELLASLQSLESDDWQLDTPPPRVWAGIERAIREQPLSDSTLPTSTQPTSTQPTSILPTSILPVTSQPVTGGRRWLVAASIVAVLGVGIGGFAVLRDGASSDVVVVAAAELTSDGLEGAPKGWNGDASVIDTGEGQIIEVRIGNLRPASGEFLEVWLIRPDVSGMVSLGMARPDGRYELPPGLRLADFPVVDVSTEPYDGDPMHSGASLLRGVLPS